MYTIPSENFKEILSWSNILLACCVDATNVAVTGQVDFINKTAIYSDRVKMAFVEESV